MKRLILLVAIAYSVGLNAQRQRYRFNLPEIQCAKTTEDGEDEVYLLLAQKTSYGAQGTSRVPATHWNIMMVII